MKIGVLLGSVRHGRKGVAVADWILRNAGPRAASYELIDLVDHVLPHLAEPTPPRVGQYTPESTTAWSAVIQGFDTFIVVTPEYNGGIPGVLKNALDHLYREWSGKPVGLVGYGFGGGSGDLSQLEALVAELGMVRGGSSSRTHDAQRLRGVHRVPTLRFGRAAGGPPRRSRGYRRAGPGRDTARFGLPDKGETMVVTQEPRGRRSRPAKPPLSRQRIVEVTLQIMRSEGLAKATMRCLARELDTGPASLYVYFANTAELHAAVVDELVGRMDLRVEGSWEERVKALVTRYRDLLAHSPGLARSALVVRPAGPHWLVLFDRVMGELLEGGSDPFTAGLGADGLLQLATATAAEHSSPQQEDVDAGTTPTQLRRVIEVAVRTADATATPHVSAHADLVLAGTPDERWDWALRIQIAGVVRMRYVAVPHLPT